MKSARPTQLRMNIHSTLTPCVGPANLTAKRIWCQMWELTTRLKTKCLPSHHLPIRILVESIFTRLHACMHACVLLAPYPGLRVLHLNNQSTSLPPSANKTGCMSGEYRFRAGRVGASACMMSAFSGCKMSPKITSNIFYVCTYPQSLNTS